MSNLVEVKIPDIGDFKDVPIIEVLVKPGDRIDKETSLITLESDKATMEVPSPEAGVVKDIRLKLGDKVSEGAVILTLETDGAAAAAPISKSQLAAAKAEAAAAPPASLTPEVSRPGAGAVERGDYHAEV